MNDIGGQERRFLDALESLFTGAQVDGQSGFINLMRLKRRYFQSLRPQLLSAIDQRARPQTAAREELFDKLYTFFGRYFCESGSIYFRHLPAFAPTYQPVYADGQDVALSWKTQDLYYVKSDTLIRSMPVVLEHPTRPDKNLRFYFDASQLQHKQNNEKRELLFQFQQTKHSPDGAVLHLAVHYSHQGRKTNMETILKQARQAQPPIRLSEEQLQKAGRVFRRQTEADFFIHKNARAFLREQFDLWMYQYLFRQETIFQEKRLAQLQALQQTAYDIIDWIAQFEDELRRIWEKPKFVRKVNYVITLDQLPVTLLRKLAQHPGAANQAQEWKELGMVEESFHFEHLLKSNRHHQHLPLDTKHFSSMKLEILATLGNLDEVLDGELVHSENWQALNTLRQRYQAKVKTIYIDPPYNTDESKIQYKNDYEHSSWLSLMENRYSLSRNFVSKEGVLFTAIDDHEIGKLNELLDMCFRAERKHKIVINHHPQGAGMGGAFISRTHEYMIAVAFSKAMPLKGRKIDEPIEIRSFRRAGQGRNNFRDGFSNSFFAVLVNPIDKQVMGLESPPEGANYPKGKTDQGYLRIYPIAGDGTERVWRYSYERTKNIFAERKLICSSNNVIKVKIDHGNERRGALFSNWTDSKYNSGPHGASLLEDIMGDAGIFLYPKSIYTIMDTIDSCTNENDLIMDYFAGSGTTAHAVINLNRGGGATEVSAH